MPTRFPYHGPACRSEPMQPRSQKRLSRRFSGTIATLVVVALTPWGGATRGDIWPTTLPDSSSDRARRIESGTKLIASEIAEMIPYPKTILQILSNIKFAVDHGSLLREQFYADEKLRAFSGGTTIWWIDRSATRLYVHISGFDKVVPSIPVNKISMPGIVIAIERSVESNGNLEGLARIFVNRPIFPFEDIEKLFGNQWRNDPILSPDRVSEKTTHPHGNARITYSYLSNSVPVSITIETGADGSLYRADFTEETK